MWEHIALHSSQSRLARRTFKHGMFVQKSVKQLCHAHGPMKRCHYYLLTFNRSILSKPDPLLGAPTLSGLRLSGPIPRALIPYLFGRGLLLSLAPNARTLGPTVLSLPLSTALSFKHTRPDLIFCGAALPAGTNVQTFACSEYAKSLIHELRCVFRIDDFQNARQK